MERILSPVFRRENA